MPEPVESSLRETLLKAILEQSTGPWYSRDYAEKTGVSRESLFAPLNDLRVAHLIELTEWKPVVGQGYQITDLGREVANDPLFLSQLRTSLSGVRKPVADESAPVSVEATPLERGDAARDALYGFRATPMVYILITLNIIGFLVSMGFAVREGVPVMKFIQSGDLTALTKAGAVGMPELAHGEWYRLLTCCFLHFGLMHITLNMTSLYLSRRAESIWGPGRLLVLYVSCGVCGSVTAMLYNPGSPVQPVYLAGASGALWGLMTSQLCWIYLNRHHFAPSEAQKAISTLSYTLLLNIGLSMLPNVSMAAHLGGGVAGLIATPLLHIHRFGAPSRQFASGVLLALLPTLFLSTLAMAIEKDSRLKVFVNSEQPKAVESSKNP